MADTIKGLTYIPDTIDPKVADELFHGLMHSLEWKPVSLSQNSRLVIHYGYIYDYTRSKKLQPTTPIPDSLAKLAAPFGEFDQLIINRYEPGQGIAPHIDDPKQFGDTILCITIGAGIQIDFTHPTIGTVPLQIEKNSAYIMKGDARYIWAHSIAPRKYDNIGDKKVARMTRISLTYRKIVK